MTQPNTDYPSPTQEERALQAKQLELLESSEAREALWEPTVMGEMGYRITTDPETGEQSLTKIPEEELLAGMSEQDRLAYDISKLASERELAALKGDLPVDPALEREILENRQELGERMYRQLGSGWETSTPGIQATAEHTQRAAELRDAMRRGEMTTSEALAQSRLGQLEEERNLLLSQSQQQSQSPLTLSSAYETPKSWHQQNRAGEFQGKLANLEAKKAMMSGISSGFGSAMSCCFNFLEAEGDIAEDVRKLRDAFYPGGSDVARGYSIMARNLVPTMRINPEMKQWVRTHMTQPFEKYAEWIYGKNNYGYIYRPIIITWVTAWERIGERGGRPYTWEEFYGLPEGSQAALRN